MTKRIARGRPAKYAHDHTGKPVVGLSFDKANNSYFNTHWKTENINRQNFGNDKSEAIARFRIWQSEKQGQTTKLDAQPHQVQIETTVTRKHSEAYLKWRDEYIKTFSEEQKKELNEAVWQGRFPALSDKVEFGTDAESAEFFQKKGYDVQQQLTLLEGIFWQNARELILSDIHKARKLLNLPIVLDGKVISEKSVTLQELGELYFEKRRKPMSIVYKKDGLRFWKEFCQCVAVPRVGDVSLELIDRYEDYLYASVKKHAWSSATLNNRIAMIKTVFANAMKRVTSPSDIEHLRIVLQYCTRLTRAEKAKVNPNPISKENFIRMLNSTEDKTYKAILLLSLNCGMRESDIIEIKITPRKGQPHADINLHEKILAMPRPKTGIIRVAVLWDRTVAAIREMLQERRVDSEYLFLNSADRKMKATNINKWWARQRKIAKIDKSVKFEHIRDATQTIPLDDDPKSLVETNLIMGHSVKGMANNYLERRPRMVRRACATIENYFFASNSDPKTKEADKKT